MEGLFDAVLSNPKFLYSSFYGFSNQDVIDFFERIGVRTKIERGGRVFPVSDHSSDVIRGLERELKRLDVEIRLNCAVKQILTDQEKGFLGFLLEDGSRLWVMRVSLRRAVFRTHPQDPQETALGLRRSWGIR